MARRTERIDLKIEDGVAIVTMTNGENRLNQAFVEDYSRALDEVERNENCKALITVGEGKFFSNGLDLDWLKTQDSNTIESFISRLGALNWRLMHFPMPTVAACNGHTFAGGAFLALSHDYVVMNSERGWICWNEMHLKMKLNQSSLHRISLKISRKDTIREAILFAKRFTALDAKTYGIIDAVATPQNLLTTAKTLCFQALGKDGLDRTSLQKMKQDLYPLPGNLSRL